MPATILGEIRLQNITIETLLAYFRTWARAEQAHCIAYLNAQCVNIATVNQAYRAALNQCQVLYPDGIGVVWAYRLLYRTTLKKMTSTDWIDRFWTLAQAEGWRIYIIASKPDVVAKALPAIRTAYPDLQIVGFCDGWFYGKTEAEVLAEIGQTRPHIVIVGMGVPKQEVWMTTHRQRMPSGIVWGVGALFDYLAGIEPRAPQSFRRMGLEWLWRLLVNPRQKWRRVLIGIPMFIVRVLHHKWRRRRPLD